MVSNGSSTCVISRMVDITGPPAIGPKVSRNLREFHESVNSTTHKNTTKCKDVMQTCMRLQPEHRREPNRNG